MAQRTRNGLLGLMLLLALLLTLVPLTVADPGIVFLPATESAPRAEVARTVESAPDSLPDPDFPTEVDAGADSDAESRSPEVREVADALAEARIAKNETAAIATLRNLCSAQSQFQATAIVDEDGDGTGEFGTFAEMAGLQKVRGGDRVMNPPVLSRAFADVSDTGTVRRAGYVFAIYLVGPGGTAVPERARGGMNDGAVDPDQSETTWVCYAWPEDQGKTGRRTFVVSQAGDILETTVTTYSDDAGPPPEAAFVPPPGERTSIKGQTATDKTGADGNEWKQAKNVNVWRQDS